MFSGKRIAFDRWCLPVEKLVYRITRVDRHREIKFAEYAASFALFGLVNTLLLYAILELQHLLSWFYPADQTMPLTSDLAMNTAVSFSTTTTWQAYSGETTMSDSYSSQKRSTRQDRRFTPVLLLAELEGCPRGNILRRAALSPYRALGWKSIRTRRVIFTASLFCP